MENRWFETYDRVMYRHLEADRSAELLRNLEDFLEDVLSKKFGINAFKLLSRTTSEPGQEESFFCSELIAAAYRRLGLLPSDVRSAGFWPRDFSKARNLPLQGEAALSDEMLVDFAL